MTTTFHQQLSVPLRTAFEELGSDPTLHAWLQLVHPDQLRQLIQQGADAALEQHSDLSASRRQQAQHTLSALEEQLEQLELLHKEVRYFIEMDVLDPQSRLSDPRSHLVHRPVMAPAIAATGFVLGGLIGAAIGPTSAVLVASLLGGGIGGWLGSRSTHRAPAEPKIKVAISALEEAVEMCKNELVGVFG